MDAEFRNGVYAILARHESRFDQIHSTLQTIRNELQSLPSSQRQLATYLPVFFNDPYVSSEVFIDFDKPPIFDEPPKRAQFHPISPPTQFSTTNHITPHHTINYQKIVKKTVQLQVLQVVVRDLDRFQHQILPTPTRAAASAAFKLHHTVHCISSTTVTTATTSLPNRDRLRTKLERPFLDSPVASRALKTTQNLRRVVLPLPVFDPGGIWVTFLQGISKFHPCGQG